MIRFTWYRWIRCVFGYRSFRKAGETTDTYALIYGDTKIMSEKLLENGYTEEWPKGE